jgi:hypothetical protein
LTGPQLAWPGNEDGIAKPADAPPEAPGDAPRAGTNRAAGAADPARAAGAGFCARMTCLTGADAPLAWVTAGVFCSAGLMSTGASVPPVRESTGSCGPALGSSGDVAGELGGEAAALGAAGGLSGAICANAVPLNSKTDMTLSAPTMFVSVHRVTLALPPKINPDITLPHHRDDRARGAQHTSVIHIRNYICSN